MLQREVADRLTATPGTRDYGVLSILIGHAAAVERAAGPAARRVPAGAEGPFRGRQAPVSRAGARGREAGGLRGDGPGDLHAPAKDALQRARGLSSERGVSARRALLEAGLDGRRRPETLSIAELVGSPTSSPEQSDVPGAVDRMPGLSSVPAEVTDSHELCYSFGSKLYVGGTLFGTS